MSTVLPRRIRATVRRAGWALLGSLLATTVIPAERGDGLLHALFQDHAVLQRERPIPVWGVAAPREALSLRFAGSTLDARADATGKWQALLPALPAGGPHTLTVTAASGRSQSAQDILVGDVWLCAGQSNMELSVSRALNSRVEIASASNDRIRLLKVPVSGVPAPQADFAGSVLWRAATSENVPNFSAACYFHARELQKTVDVPMGLINPSLGGSRIEAWMSAAALRAAGGHDASLDALAQFNTDPQAANARWGEVWAQWWRALPGVPMGDEPWSPADSGTGWRDAPRNLISYTQWGVPELSGFVGMLWYRTTVRLSAQQAAQEAMLLLGNVDEMDQSWVNGRGVGASYGGGERSYPLPRGLLRAGENLITVNALNTYIDGGVIGPTESRALRFADGSTVLLDAGGWQYRQVPKEAGTPPLAPWLSAAGQTTLHNGMIAPLGSYGLRGALWYQGESNIDDARDYAPLLAAFREGLRAQFGAQLPLLIVQLPGYGAVPTRPVESGWATLREAQRRVAAADANSGLVVTIDIGDRYDIHPANKQEVGRRLARAARHVVYGEALPPSGPEAVAARRDGEAIVVAFEGITGQLTAYGAARPIGFELCGVQAGSCVYANAGIRDGEVLLQAEDIAIGAVTRVRYCWGDSPVCTLYDQAGLPAGPFELEVTPRQARLDIRRSVEISPARDLRYYNEQRRDYAVGPDNYAVQLSASSSDIRLTRRFAVRP